MDSFKPDANSASIGIPVTFDFHGGRSQSVRGKVFMSLILTAVLGVGTWVILKLLADSFELWQRLVMLGVLAYVLLLIERFLVLHELRFSDMLEELKRIDYQPETTVFWRIFEITGDYPYICYYQNGYKGIFVRMEHGVVSGKPATAVYDHYEHISEAYKLAHSMNMNIVAMDYMDKVGNDTRLEKKLEDTSNITNPDMATMMIDLYTHLKEEASHNYASYDVYLFLTKDKAEKFLYNIRSVTNAMLGGNYITYSFLNRAKIRDVCAALLNLHDISVNDACAKVTSETSHRGIVPIAVIHADGTMEKLNDTVEERQRKQSEAMRKRKDAQLARKNKKQGVDDKNVTVPKDKDEDLNIF